MITARPQKDLVNAKEYFRKHLATGDYHSEGERVKGFWFGKGGERLGLDLKVPVSEAAFMRLCDNQHPLTGGQLTARQRQKDRRIFYDFAISAPKSVSILALTVGDIRLIKAHDEAALEAMAALEGVACTRTHRGNRTFDATTGEIVAAAFRHDASRALDPQLHTHFVVFNATWDALEQRWKALQTSMMFERMTYFTEIYRNALARRIQGLGYQIRTTANGFEIEGVLPGIIQRFSKRRRVILDEEAKMSEEEGRALTNNERAQLARESRPKKQENITPIEILAQQRAQLSSEEFESLRRLVEGNSKPREVLKPISAAEAIHYARDHLFERHSVVSDYLLLREALVYARGSVEIKALETELSMCPDLISVGSQLTTRGTLRSEQRMIALVNQGMGKFRPLNAAFKPSAKLKEEQRLALGLILRAPDQVIGLRGGAGTGKTTVIRELVRAIEERQPVFVMAPNTAAVETLREEGLTRAATVQRFLADENFQRDARGKVLVVDEAGLLSTQDMVALMECARLHQCRVVLSGDTRQHAGVQAGDSLRLLEQRSGLRMVGINKIHRQINTEYREAIAECAQGKGCEALMRLEKIGAVKEVKGPERYVQLAEDFHGSLKAKKSALIVIPTWREIKLATESVRACLKKEGVVSESESKVSVHAPLKWTLAQKQDLRNYREGLVLAFHKRTREFQPGDSAEVVRAGPNLLEVKKPNGQLVELTKKQARCFEVAEKEDLMVGAGERLLLLGNRKKDGLINGQIVTVKKVKQSGRISLTDGRSISPDFRAFTYGYCVTSHASQGRTVDHVYVAVDSNTDLAANRKQFYVSASRARERVKIFTDDLEFLWNAVQRSGERMSATELMESARLGERAKVAEQPKVKTVLSV